MKILSGQGIVEVLGLTVLYLFSLTPWPICYFSLYLLWFSAFVFKILWGSTLLKTSIVAFIVWEFDSLGFLSKGHFRYSVLLTFLILNLHSGHDYCWEIRCQSDSSSTFASVFLAYSDGGLSQLIGNESSHLSLFKEVSMKNINACI